MSDIPEDILARSIDVWNRARAENSPDAIAEALMAERERAATIADELAQPGPAGSPEWFAMGSFAAAIRDAIRSPDTGTPHES